MILCPEHDIERIRSGTLVVEAAVNAVPAARCEKFC